MRVLRWTGRFLTVVAVVALLLAVLKGFYGLGSAPARSDPFAGVWSSLAQLIGRAYGAAASFAPPLVEFAWRLAPDIDPRRPIWNGASLGFWIAYVMLFIGIAMRSDATRWQRELAEHRKRMQQIVWEEEARSLVATGTSSDEALSRLELKLTIAPPPSAWHTSLAGVVVLGLALPLIVEIVKVWVGLGGK